MKKLFASFFLVLFAVSFSSSRDCTSGVPQCQGPPSPPLPCEAYWVCWCEDVVSCPTAEGGWLFEYEAQWYW